MTKDLSRPTRARGLKLRYSINKGSHPMSRPTRARGLKLSTKLDIPVHLQVAPHAGAWIETCAAVTLSSRDLSRAPRGRVD